MGESDRHARKTMTESQRAWIAGLPPVLRPAEGVFMCHATPYNDTDCYLEDLVEGELRPAPFAASRSDRAAAMRRSSCAAIPHSSR